MTIKFVGNQICNVVLQCCTIVRKGTPSSIVINIVGQVDYFQSKLYTIYIAVHLDCQNIFLNYTKKHIVVATIHYFLRN